KIKALSEKDYASVPAFRRLLDELQKMPRITSPKKAQVPDLHAKLDSLKESYEHLQQRLRALARVKAAAGNLPNYVAALETYAQAYPETPEGKSFSKLAKNEMNLWRAVEPWNDLITKWSQTDFTKVTPEEAKNLVGELETTIQ